jgi:hypothetical protein
VFVVFVALHIDYYKVGDFEENLVHLDHMIVVERGVDLVVNPDNFVGLEQNQVVVALAADIQVDLKENLVYIVDYFVDKVVENQVGFDDILVLLGLVD